MKLLKILSIFFLFTNILNAQYIRTIRIGSFHTDKDAQAALIELQEYVALNETLSNLEQERIFKFKTRKSGKLYITLAEPFTDKHILQDVLDIMRIEYPDIYVTRLKNIPHIQVKIIEKKNLPPKIVIPVIQEKKIFIETNTSIKKVLPEVKIVTIAKKKNVKPFIEKQQLQDTPNLYKTISILLLFIILLLVWLIYRYKRKEEIFLTQQMVCTQKLEQNDISIRTKSKLLSHVSHELRTPMTAIMGLTHLILESELSKLQQDYILKIENSSKHLLSLLNDILDVSKIQAGELKIEEAEFNISDILDYVLSVSSAQAKRNSVVLSMDIGNEVPSKIVGDSLRLGQILINLISNAVKFTNEGEVSLKVKHSPNIGGEHSLEFSVTDTGIGMTQEAAENVFNSYYQATDSTSRKFGGTGLGLSISKELVEMMQGNIKVSSEENIGSTFSFRIPLRVRDAQNRRQYRLPLNSMLDKKILIVDALSTNVLPLIKSLSYFNYKTNSIPSFEEAILEENTKFDILIVNQHKLTELAIIKIKKMQKSMKSKLVVLSELYSDLNPKLLKDIHTDAYLQTPCTQQAVLHMITTLYAPRKSQNAVKHISQKDRLKQMKNKRILIAEDNEINQKVILGLLTQTGIDLTFADDGQEAVTLMQRGINFDLILMDINMPKLNGYEATQEIRKNQLYNKIPILALTGDVMDEAITKAHQSGMQGHISKPIIVDIFYNKIFDALNTTVTSKKEESKGHTDSIDDDFKELSITIGIQRCQGDINFYKSILEDFKNMYMNSTKSVKQLCTNGDFKEARLLARDIKDVSLNIGAYNLCESAASMEYEFEKGERSNHKEFIDFYAGVLENLLYEIDLYLHKKV